MNVPLLRAAAVAALLLALPARSARAQDPGDGLPLPATKLTMWNGSPYIDLTISGVRGRFLVDTGANTSGIDRTWLSSSGIPTWQGAPLTVGGTTGVVGFPTVTVGRVDLGRGFFTSPSFVVQDFGSFSWPGGEPQAGLLGTDFLSAYALTLDLARGEATFALPWERKADPNETWVPLDYPLNLPTASAQLGGLTIPTRLDSGAAYFDSTPYLDVNWATVNALQNSGIRLEPRGWINVSGVSGFESLPLYGAAPGSAPLDLSFGPAKIPDVTLVVHNSGTLAVNDPVALAGASLLARLGRITLDPVNRRLVLEDRARASTGIVDALR